jgi:hypothetical protein
MFSAMAPVKNEQWARFGQDLFFFFDWGNPQIFTIQETVHIIFFLRYVTIDDLKSRRRLFELCALLKGVRSTVLGDNLFFYY